MKPISSYEWFEDFSRFVNSYAGVIRLFILIFFMLIMAHITACLWYYTARLDDFGPETWVVRNGFTDRDKGQLYLTSLYWALTILTTVGFGDVHAMTSLEMSLCIVWLIFGIVFYSFLIGSLTSVLSKIDAKNSNLNEHIKDMEQLAKDYHLPKGTLKVMKRELKYYSDFRIMQLDERLDKLSMLSKDLREKICFEMNGGAINSVKFLRDQDCIFIINIVPKLIYEKFEVEKFVYKQGEHPDAVYFIVKGSVNYLVEDQEIIFKKIESGGYFGEIEFVKDCIREFSVLASDYCTFLVMKKHLFKEVMTQYAKVAEEIRENAYNKDIKNKQAMVEATDMMKKEQGKKNNSRRNNRERMRSSASVTPLMTPSRIEDEQVKWLYGRLKDLTQITQGYIDHSSF